MHSHHEVLVRAEVVLSVVLIATACGTGDTAPTTPTTSAVSVAGTSVATVPAAAGSAPSATTSTTTPTAVPEAADSAPGPLPASLVRAQFEYFEGGDLTDPCNLQYGEFAPPANPPSVFLGPEGNYWGFEGPYRIGWDISWCIIGFQPTAPIDVTIRRPDGSTHAFVVITTPLIGTQCRYGFDKCRLSEVLLPVEPYATEFLVVNAFQSESGWAASVGSWLTPGAQLGAYHVTARQGSLMSETAFELALSDKPGVAVAHAARSPDGSQITAYFVGFEPGSEILPTLYAPAPADCALVDCSVGNETAWTAWLDLPRVGADEHGNAAATFTLETPLAEGSYCVLTAETVPAPPAMDYANPCWYLSEHYAGFRVLSEDLALRALPSRPPCSGRYIAVLGSAVDPSSYSEVLQPLLERFPGSSYLRTDATGCASLRQSLNGAPIYAAYYGPYATLDDACAVAGLGPPDAYVKILDNDTDPGVQQACP